MAENLAENAIEEEIASAEVKPSKGQKFKEGFKEWGRKQIVNLKRAPQRIPLLMLVITTALWLIWLFTFSEAVYYTSAVNWTGLMVFCNTLLSILILALFLSAFPKRKKANKVFVAMLFVFMALIICCDVVYYILESKYLAEQAQSFVDTYKFLNSSLNLAIVHVVLVAICAVLLATLPLYSKLINKINTKKEIESTQLSEEIDTSAEV